MNAEKYIDLSFQAKTYMNRALVLAALGRGHVSPNPMVGCVVVRKGEIISEGYHQQYGGPHAEVNALAQIPLEIDLSEATAYVSLEPCNHYGKTPPCTELLINRGVGRVVIATTDPNPLVAGEGIKRLESAGIAVEVGLAKETADQLNQRFFTQMMHKRPYVILKWAETADGFIARKDYSSKWISHWLSRKLVHKWRAEEDAVMVGTQTALYDDPLLTAREWPAHRQPYRIVIDRNLRLPESHQLFDGHAPTLCFNTLKSANKPNLSFIKIPADASIPNMMQRLQDFSIQSVIVEGGSQLLQSFIAAGCWDEARVFKSPQVFGDGIPAPQLRAHLMDRKNVATDTLYYYRPV